MAKYLKSQQRLIDTLIDGESTVDQRRNVSARIASRPARQARARKTKGTKTMH